jgi:hypothetical protein
MLLRHYLPYMDSFQAMYAIPNRPTAGLYAFGDFTPLGPFAVL